MAGRLWQTLGDIYERSGDSDSLLSGSEKLAHWADKKKDTLNLGIANFLKATYFKSQREFSEAFEEYERAENFFVAIPNFRQVLKMIKLKGVIHFHMQKPEEARRVHQEGLALAKREGDKKMEVEMVRNIAISYWVEQDYKETIKGYKKALSLNETLNDPSLTLRLQRDIGQAYELDNNHEESLIWFEKALASSEQLNDLSMKANILIEIANVYDKNDYPLSL